MATGLVQALLKIAPGSTGLAGDIARPYSTAVTVTSSADTLVLPAEGGIPYGGTYTTWIASVDTCIRFGLAGLGAAVTTDFILPANVMIDWWIFPDFQPNFRVIRAASATADGTIVRYRSNK